MYFDQREYDIRFEWGLSGVQALAPSSDVIVIIDVLSFTTCVDIAIGNGAVVYPYNGSADKLDAFAQERDALVARRKREKEAAFTLSPTSLMNLPAGAKLVLPSPNGSTLSLATGNIPTLAGCLRNAQAVAQRAQQLGQRISVIASGERWWPEALLRPSVEDLLGAGAILSYLGGNRSPEAELAVASFHHAQNKLLATLQACGSGKELIGKGFPEDVVLASQLNVSTAQPLLVDGAYRI